MSNVPSRPSTVSAAWAKRSWSRSGKKRWTCRVAEARIVAERAVRALVLAEQGGGDRPVLGKLDAQGGAAADHVDVVIILLDQRVVVDDDAARARQERAGAGDIVHIAGVVRVPGDQAHGGIVAQRRVDEAFDRAADAAVADRVELAVEAAGEMGRIGPVGDDADRAGLGRGAVERALRPAQHLDAGDVVDMDVERAADRGDRLLVEIDADAGQRARMVAVAAAGDAADIDVGRARLEGLVGDARQQPRIILEIGDVEVFELLRAQRLDADRHVLEIFGALLRGDDDDVAIVLRGRGGRRLGGLGRLGEGGSGGAEHGRAEQAECSALKVHTSPPLASLARESAAFRGASNLFGAGTRSPANVTELQRFDYAQWSRTGPSASLSGSSQGS